jgi:hypothetical protein
MLLSFHDRTPKRTDRGAIELPLLAYDVQDYFEIGTQIFHIAYYPSIFEQL